MRIDPLYCNRSRRSAQCRGTSETPVLGLTDKLDWQIARHGSSQVMCRTNLTLLGQRSGVGAEYD